MYFRCGPVLRPVLWSKSSVHVWYKWSKHDVSRGGGLWILQAPLGDFCLHLPTGLRNGGWVVGKGPLLTGFHLIKPGFSRCWWRTLISVDLALHLHGSVRAVLGLCLDYRGPGSWDLEVRPIAAGNPPFPSRKPSLLSFHSCWKLTPRT